jgi:hypothetical protein
MCRGSVMANKGFREMPNYGIIYFEVKKKHLSKDKLLSKSKVVKHHWAVHDRRGS